MIYFLIKGIIQNGFFNVTKIMYQIMMMSA